MGLFELDKDLTFESVVTHRVPPEGREKKI